MFLTRYRTLKPPKPNQLGEGITWSPRHNSLFWVDILAPAVLRYDLTSRQTQSWTMPEPMGWIIERAGRDDFIVGLKSGFAVLSLAPFTLTPIGDPEPDRPNNRLNDAKVDPWGRIWTGSLNDQGAEASGGLYRLDADLRWSRHDDGFGVTNGPAFSVDGRTLFHTDSAARTVFAYDLDDQGNLSNRRVHIRFAEDWGHPDGMTTDAKGHLWIAHWGGGRVSRFRPDGTWVRSIALPASQITNCAFGGARLDRLFVTSAAVGKPGERRAGALFEVNPRVQGLAPTLFSG